MSDSVTIEDSKGETFAEVIDVIGVSEVKKAFQKSIEEGSLHNCCLLYTSPSPRDS